MSHEAADIETKTRLTPAEMLGFQQLARAETRSASNLQRHLIVQLLRSRLSELSEDVRAALVQQWDS